MRHCVILIVLMLLLPHRTDAQQYERIWMFGESNTLDFGGASPVPGGIPNTGGNPPQWYFHRSGAVCDAAGQLKFWVKLQSQTGPNAASTPNVFDRFGNAMPNGALLSNYSSDGVPVFVPFPGDTNRYYIFYIKNGGLLYSVVDLKLNGGNGDVSPAQKNVQLGGWNNFIDFKMTAVQGCRGVWIVARARGTNEFYAYEITRSGVAATPVISQCGSLPVAWYANGNNTGNGYYPRGGVMKASPDGKKLVIATNASLLPEFPGKGGVEIFDFESCSGKVSNPLLLATGSYYGACFSPDNSKLYTTAIYERRLYQFDLSLSTTAAIIASKTLILTNPTYNAYPESWLLGDAKRGLDGKIYLGNYNCDAVNTNAMHVINAPNLAGIACAPAVNAVSLGPNAGCTGFNLPADIVSFNEPDTAYGKTEYFTACFADSFLLKAAPYASCYRWLDSVDGSERKVTKGGYYVATYYDGNCTYHIDSFHVHFPVVPKQALKSFTCPNNPNGRMMYRNTDSTTFTYTWAPLNGPSFRSTQTAIGDSISGLDTGAYQITFSLANGCSRSDTFRIEALPIPVAGFDIPDVACNGAAVAITSTSAAPLVKWYFEYDSSAGKSAEREFWKNGPHMVTQVVTNLEGCMDTLEKAIVIRDFKISLEASETLAKKGDVITIRSFAAEPYSVLSWRPYDRFGVQNAVSQSLRVDTLTKVFIRAISDIGCEDTAAVTVNVKPIVFIPSAFSPNGDGKNDRFRVVCIGAPVFIRYFYVYNRWGQMIYGQQGPSATNGWDGHFNGAPVDVGTYYYVIELEDPQGKTIYQKGDVTLVR